MRFTDDRQVPLREGVVYGFEASSSSKDFYMVEKDGEGYVAVDQSGERHEVFPPRGSSVELSLPGNALFSDSLRSLSEPVLTRIIGELAESIEGSKTKLSFLEEVTQTKRPFHYSHHLLGANSAQRKPSCTDPHPALDIIEEDENRGTQVNRDGNVGLTPDASRVHPFHPDW
jgi:hypothetical protein